MLPTTNSSYSQSLADAQNTKATCAWDFCPPTGSTEVHICISLHSVLNTKYCCLLFFHKNCWYPFCPSTKKHTKDKKILPPICVSKKFWVNFPLDPAFQWETFSLYLCGRVFLLTHAKLLVGEESWNRSDYCKQSDLCIIEACSHTHVIQHKLWIATSEASGHCSHLLSH